MIHTSRSAIVTRKTCAMKRYWAYEAQHPDIPTDQQVGGLTPVTDPTHHAKQRGTLFHALMEAATLGEDIDAAATRLTTPELDRTLLTLCRRAAKGWRLLHAEWLQDYTPLSAEVEWEWALSPYVAQSLRLDQILRHNDSGSLLILDYKTMARPDPNWVYRLWHSDQTHLYIQALIERTQELVAMQYEGIVIGTYEKGVYKSPLVSAFLTKQGHTVPGWVAGATRIDTTEWADDEWLAWMQEHVALHDLYCTTGPLQPTTQSLLATKNATARAELQWADTLAQITSTDDPDAQALLREQLIERNPDACYKYGYGYACPFVPLCWHGHAPDPQAFLPRQDHHQRKEDE